MKKKHPVGTMPPILFAPPAVIGFILGLVAGMWEIDVHHKRALSYSTYERECRADSTASLYGYFEGQDGRIRIQYTYTHRTPTMEGYGEWVKEKTK